MQGDYTSSVANPKKFLAGNRY